MSAASNGGTEHRIAELRQLAANPSDAFTAGVWCEALNDALELIDTLKPSKEIVRESFPSCTCSPGVTSVECPWHGGTI